MTQKVMYPGMVNSPETTITNNINESDTIIYVLDPARVPEPPNLMTLGTGTNAETVKVTAVNDNALTVERGFQGIAKSWPAGTVIARNFTEYDYQAMKENIEELDENLGDLAGEGRTTETVKGIADALDSHLAESVQDDVHGLAWGDTFEVVLQNGWTGTLLYSKNSLGFVWLRGELTVGTHADNTIIGMLPNGYHGPVTMPFIFYRTNYPPNSFLGGIVGGGTLVIRGTASAELRTDDTVRINTIYKVEV